MNAFRYPLPCSSVTHLLDVLVANDGTYGTTAVFMPARLTLLLFRSGFIVVVTVFSFIRKTNWIE
jgi:hypothetical protein